MGHQPEDPSITRMKQAESEYGIVYVMGNAGSKTYAGAVIFLHCSKQAGSNYQVIDIEGDVLTMTSKQSTSEPD